MAQEEENELLSCKTNEATSDGERKSELCSRSSLLISQAVNRSIFNIKASPTTERIFSTLVEEDEPKIPPLFTELDELIPINGKTFIWKETTR